MVAHLFWQTLADYFFYKVWLAKNRHDEGVNTFWGLHAYYICIAIKHKKTPFKQGVKELWSVYKHRKEA